MRFSHLVYCCGITHGRTHALRGAVTVFFRWFRSTLHGGAGVPSRGGGALGDRQTPHTGCGPANTESGGESMCTPRPVRPLEGLCPGHAAAGNSAGPSRHAGVMPPPTPHTCGGGTVDPGGASGPKTSSRCVRCPGQSRPMFVVRQRWQSVHVVHHRRRAGGRRRQAQRLGGLESGGSREGSGPVARWRGRSRRWPAR